MGKNTKRRKAPKTPQEVLGVLCDFALDENGFYNVYIAGEKIPDGLSEKELARRFAFGEILLHEWIVRGALTERKAYDAAAWAIDSLRQGYRICQRGGPDGSVAFRYFPKLNAKVYTTTDYGKFEPE